MKISKHQMERRAIVAGIKRVLLDAIDEEIEKHEVTYAELVHALQELQSRFILSMVVNEWDDPEESAQSIQE